MRASLARLKPWSPLALNTWFRHAEGEATNCRKSETADSRRAGEDLAQRC
jgi:hypothetical protein